MVLEAYKYFSDPTFIRDPVHRADIRLSSFETAIIDTRAFQRLRGIKQLGPCEMVWHGATHTRFQHSIGTLHIAQQIADHINSPGELGLPFAKLVVIRLFALLHDIGHIPFGHTIEDERPSIMGHHTDRERIEAIMADGIYAQLDVIEKECLQDEIDRKQIGFGVEVGGSRKRKLSSLSALITELICECKGETDELEDSGYTHNKGVNKPSGKNEVNLVPPELSIYLDIVGNTVCADLFDYLRRDTYYTGLRRDYDDRIINNLHLHKETIPTSKGQKKREIHTIVLDILSPKAGSGGSRTELINLMNVRHSLTERVYFNKTKIWAAGMISKAIDLTLLPSEFFYDKTDDDLLWILEHDQALVSANSADSKQRPKCSGPAIEMLAPPGDENLSAEFEKRKTIGDLWQGAWKRMEKAAIEPDLDGASNLIRAYRRRSLFSPVYSLTVADDFWRDVLQKHFHDYSYQSFRLAMEAFIARLSGLEPWQVVICCPHPKMNLKFANPKIGPFPPPNMYRELNSLQDLRTNPDSTFATLVESSLRVCQAHSALWRFDVIIPKIDGKITSTVRGVCESLFFKENNATRGVPGAVNLEMVKLENVTTAMKEVLEQEPTYTEVQAVLMESHQGDQRPIFVDDFKNFIKKRDKKEMDEEELYE